MRRLLVLIPIVLLFSMAACSPTPTPTLPAPDVKETPVYVGMEQGDVGPSRAVFELRFEGTFAWTYRLETRSDGEALEYRLHIEGVSAAQNPGDVRMVMAGDEATMRGPGTGDECVRFPSDLELGVSFLTPDDVIDPDDLESLDVVGSETVAGRAAGHYAFLQEEAGEWRDLEGDLWLDEETRALLRYELRAAGSDPLFDAGEGTLEGQFLVSEIGPQTIEPIAGCEIGLPLPPGATRLVRLPGLVAFESAESPAEIVAFYQDELAEDGWEARGEPEEGVDATVLSYVRNGETLEINVEVQEEGALVELLIGRE
jgi:hypothetical protein